jgi:medium-chain acyl-[acyl-carrier-protein] hydrolase
MTAPVRLFCIPFAGGSARAYRPWRPLLDERIDLVAMELPGRDSRRREPLPGTVAELVADLAEQVRAGGTGEYALYGHSFGGLLAYETARLLARSGHPAPRGLLVSGSRPPHLGPRFHRVHTFPDQALLGALGMLGGVAEEVLRNADAVRYFAVQIRNDYRLFEQYRHSRAGELLRCPITVITGDHDPVTSGHDADEWQRLTTSPVTAVELAGAGHFFLETHAEELAGLIREALEPAAAPDTAGQFREAMGRLPAGPSVVTTLAEGRPEAFTATSVCALSVAPPLLAVCVGRGDAFTPGRRFLVNVLGAANRAAAEQVPVPCELGLPGLAGAVLRLACTKERTLHGGDHSILVGRVAAVSTA